MKVSWYFLISFGERNKKNLGRPRRSHGQTSQQRLKSISQVNPYWNFKQKNAKVRACERTGSFKFFLFLCPKPIKKCQESFTRSHFLSFYALEVKKLVREGKKKKLGEKRSKSISQVNPHWNFSPKNAKSSLQGTSIFFSFSPQTYFSLVLKHTN